MRPALFRVIQSAITKLGGRWKSPYLVVADPEAPSTTVEMPTHTVTGHVDPHKFALCGRMRLRLHERALELDRRITQFHTLHKHVANIKVRLDLAQATPDATWPQVKPAIMLAFDELTALLVQAHLTDEPLSMQRTPSPTAVPPT